MSLIGFSTLYQMADQLSSPIPVVAAGGADRTVLEAMSIAQRRGWISPILVGRLAEIRPLAADLDIDLTDFGLVDSIDPAMDAVAEVRAGRALALMKGQIATPELMRAILQRDSTYMYYRNAIGTGAREAVGVRGVEDWLGVV